MKREQLNGAAWGLTLFVSAIALVAWLGVYSSRQTFSAYSLFPLFGLLAFSIMWAHYMVALLRLWYGLSKDSVKRYFDLTSYAVLGFILLHPGLLIWTLWQDGLGLPPDSVKLFAGKVLYSSVLLGIIALIIFIAYELRRFIHNERWRSWLQFASDGAMLLIIVHGFRLGMVTQTGWFTAIWWFYAVSLLLSLGVRSYLAEKA